MVADRVELRPVGGRSLKTAAEALSALRILGDNPAGITADVLAVALGKSAATARYLLNTLCQEGFAVREGGVGVHRLVAAPPWGEPWGRSAPAPRDELAATGRPPSPPEDPTPPGPPRPPGSPTAPTELRAPPDPRRAAFPARPHHLSRR